MAEFRIPPISTLIGGTWRNYIRTLRGNQIEPRNYLKIFLTGLVIALCWPLRIYERFSFSSIIPNFKHDNDPIFILGHWRSGTTFLHSTICKAQSASYLTTYFSVFPDYLKSKTIFNPFMKANMPETRPSDNVKLRAESPQEDEFALSCLTPYSYYNFWVYPKRANEFYEKYVRFNENEGIKEEWKENYIHLLKKANINVPGSQLIIKNPVNTGRIKTLLEIYPNAKFIYLVRDPLTVYMSSLKFFADVLQTVSFHTIDHNEMEKLILNTYVKMVHDFERDKALIPDGNLVEIKFEDFEANPLQILRKIYENLSLPDFEKDKPEFESYLKSLKNYKKNNYHPTRKQIQTVTKNWGFAYELYKYNLPIEQSMRPREEYQSTN